MVAAWFVVCCGCGCGCDGDDDDAAAACGCSDGCGCRGSCASSDGWSSSVALVVMVEAFVAVWWGWCWWLLWVFLSSVVCVAAARVLIWLCVVGVVGVFCNVVAGRGCGYGYFYACGCCC